jgi:RND superfamily putative drug exporter
VRKTAAEDAVTLLGKMSDVAAVCPAVFNQSGDVALLSVVPNSSPSRQATVDLATEIRDRGPP